MSLETKKVIAYESDLTNVASSFEKEGWSLESQERVDILEAKAMFKRDSRIVNSLTKEKADTVLLLLFQREKIKAIPQEKAVQIKPEISLAEKKREQKEPVFWLIACSILFAGSFAFFIYSLPRADKDFTFWIALVNSIFMLAGIVYSIVQIVRTRRDL